MKTIPKAFGRPKELLNMFEDRGVRGTTGTLRLKVLLGNSAQYTWQVTANVGTQIVDEIRLLPGDAFVPVKCGMYIQKVASTLTDSDQTTAIDRTYPNSSIFTGTNEAALLEGMYKGRLIFNLNSVDIIKFMDTLQFRRVGVAQQGLVVSQLASPVTPAAYMRDEWNGPDYGFIPLPQDMLFNGQANSTIDLKLPTAINAAGTSSSNYVILEIRGVMLPNGAGIAQDQSIKTFLKKKWGGGGSN